MSVPVRAHQLCARARELGPYLTDRLGGDARVTTARLAGEGMSANTLLLDLSDGRELVLRARGPKMGSSTIADSDEPQFRVLRAVADQDVPAPPALFFEPDPDVLGAPFLAMERLPGKAIVPWSRDGRAFLAEVGRGRAGEQFMRYLVAIHGVRPDHPELAKVFSVPPPGTAVAQEALDRASEVLDRCAWGPDPVFADALGWLRAHLPECPSPGLVHGDYRAGNLLFSGEQISGVLDWEFAHLGDPARDLAWLMAKSNRVGDDLACDMIPLNEVLTRYRAAGGREIDPAAVAFWNIFWLVENGVIWLTSTESLRAGELSDVRITKWSYSLPTIRLMVLDALEEAGT
jgi:aminoglycoside phosphotransferase (APT) family kinase protein